MVAIAARHLKLFFRDRSSVVMSFLSVFVILGLYILFLGDTMANDMADTPEKRHLLDSWVMAGILAVTTATSTLGAFGIMVEDKARKLSKDFAAAPVKRHSIVGGYVLGSCAIGVILSLVTLAIAETYIVLRGGAWLGAAATVKVLGLILLSVLASSAMMFLMSSLLRSMSAFSTASTITGTLIGFLTGIYIPIGSLPEGVQWVIKLFPVSHAGALIRSVMIEQPMAAAFAGAPQSAVESFRLDMGVAYPFGDAVTTTAVSLAVLVGTAALFYALSIARMARAGE
ncbi:MAG: transporter permease [Paenibacillus sp.]|jgi:multidrug/hemolysin transport system permease protein|nr:transporter permease [Paenibacillus sp.]